MFPTRAEQITIFFFYIPKGLLPLQITNIIDTDIVV